jgi:hypothetical protein
LHTKRRIARYQRREAMDDRATRDGREHVQRQEAGIKDPITERPSWGRRVLACRRSGRDLLSAAWSGERSRPQRGR